MLLIMSHTRTIEALEEVKQEFSSITPERKEILQMLSQKIKVSIEKNGFSKVIFVCTHNSRRSHLAQVWAAAAAKYYDVPLIAYSGGTESTAVYPSTLAALESLGMRSEQISDGVNPVHLLHFAEQAYPLALYSKTYDHASNPQEDFGTVMTCGHAEENCPYIPEAAFRIAVTYEDPKHSDGSPEEDRVYLDTAKLIAREMCYTLSLV
jgi:arsenate reductase